MANIDNILDLKKENKTPAVWRQAFRPFFLAGTLFSILSLTTWVMVLSGKLDFQPYGNITFWHAHEMLFGFVGAIIVGFLLTAVQNWTGLRATNGKPLAGLFTIWLVARLLMVAGLESYQWLLASIDLSFFLGAGLLMAQLVVKAGNYRNLFFVPILTLLALANLLTHLSIILHRPHYFTWGVYAAIMLVTLLMVVVSGRVMPMFTANGTGTKKTEPLPWLEKAVLLSTGLSALLFITNSTSSLPNNILVALFVTAALANAYRALRWRPQIIWQTPLVWSLHLAYWFIPLGFSLLAMHFAGFEISLSTAIHSLTAGAMGSLILAMISRVSLGHTGRPLNVHKCIPYAFALIAMAGFSRILVGFSPSILGGNGYILSAACWVLAYSAYLIVYFRILTTPKPDGRPG